MLNLSNSQLNINNYSKYRIFPFFILAFILIIFIYRSVSIGGEEYEKEVFSYLINYYPQTSIYILNINENSRINLYENNNNHNKLSIKPSKNPKSSSEIESNSEFNEDDSEIEWVELKVNKNNFLKRTESIFDLIESNKGVNNDISLLEEEVNEIIDNVKISKNSKNSIINSLKNIRNYISTSDYKLNKSYKYFKTILSSNVD